MTDIRPGANADSNDAMRRQAENINDTGLQMPGVDFEALNFEQRRAPYDSGHRFIKDPVHDAHSGNTDGNKHS